MSTAGDRIHRLNPSFKDVGYYLKQYLAKYITPASRVLDVGCGRQTFGDEYYRRAREWVGVDPDRHAIEENTMPLTGKLCSEIQHIPLSLGTFDVITAQWVFEHLRDPKADLKRLSELCRPGGFIIFTTTNVRSPLMWLSKIVPTSIKKNLRKKLLGIEEKDTYPTVYRVNTPHTINEYMLDAGFVKVEVRTVGALAYFSFNTAILRLKVLFDRLIDPLGIFSSMNTHIVGVYQKTR
ncbi:MAG: class I SAM-dependent methyltransferase [Parcubacteria group bacterium]